MAVDFVHIHNHSQYSKFDGLSSIEDVDKGKFVARGIVSTAKSMGMKSVGLTDHGTFAGAIKFIKTCREEGIRPILGMEAYLSRNHQNKNTDGRKGNRHINVIAKNFVGFQNVCALSQIASLEGFYHNPRIDFELLEKHSEGVICTSACLSNIINWNLSIDRFDEAKAAAGCFKEIFGDDFYLEIMYHGIDAEGKILPEIQRLAKQLDIKLLATNDCHYILREDAKYHEYLLCLNTKKCIKDPKRIHFPYDEFYFKSPEEMYKIFGHVPSAMSNTIELADKCDYSDLKFINDPGGEMLLPRFIVPEESSTPYDYLVQLAQSGLKKFRLDESKPHRERLDLELSDLKLVWDVHRWDFATYFLIVHDVFEFCKKKKIAAGIRGSGFGSLLLKCLGISEGIDPLEQDLLWARFLGFDDKIYLSESDFGIKDSSQVNKKENGDGDATEKMFDRYH